MFHSHFWKLSDNHRGTQLLSEASIVDVRGGKWRNLTALCYHCATDATIDETDLPPQTYQDMKSCISSFFEPIWVLFSATYNQIYSIWKHPISVNNITHIYMCVHTWNFLHESSWNGICWVKDFHFSFNFSDYFFDLQMRFCLSALFGLSSHDFFSVFSVMPSGLCLVWKDLSSPIL